MNDEAIRAIKLITSDICAIQDFINDLKNNVSPIKKMYIVTDKQYSIELIHSFDEQTSLKIFNLIIENRQALEKHLQEQLNKLTELTKKD